MSDSLSASLKLRAVLTVAVGLSLAAGCARTETPGTEAAPAETRTYPDQRLVVPVNDPPPGPYTRVHPWGEMPYDEKNYDARAAVIGVDEGPDGNVYVLTRCNRNSCAGRKEPPIMKFSSDGKLLASWGAGLFEFPHGLDVDREGNVWTSDEGNHVVRKFSPTGDLLMTIGEVGQPGDAPNRLNEPTSVKIAPNGNIFVTEGHSSNANAPSARVTKWAPDGKFIKSWGSPGTAPGQFLVPHSIEFDSQGRVFVADRHNNRIQIFDQEGNFLDLWYQFGRPSSVVITPDDRIYVADSESYDFHNPGWEKGIRIGSAKDGKVEYFVRDIEPTSTSHSGAEGMAVDSKGNIYLAVVRRRMLEKLVPRG
jgi:sugar lactone lactonase YvrE